MKVKIPKIPAANRKWSGMCPAGLHGLDYEGQECDVCRHDADPENCTQNRNHCRRCWAKFGRLWGL